MMQRRMAMIDTGSIESNLHIIRMALKSPVIVSVTAAVCVLLIIADWKIFEKADIKGWKSIIPFYNAYLLFKLCWGNGYWFFLYLLGFVPVIGTVSVLVITFVTEHKLSVAFGHTGLFTVGLIFLPNVFTMMLALDENPYMGPLKEKQKKSSETL